MMAIVSMEIVDAKNMQNSIATIENLSPDETILSLKKRITQINGSLSVERQSLRLDARGKNLNDETYISDLNLPSKGAQLFLKDLGPQISWKTVFLAEYAGPFFIYPVFFFRPGIFYGIMSHDQSINVTSSVRLALLCWTFHYLKRLYETERIHRFSNATMPRFNILKNCAYYWGFCAFISYFINHPHYTPPYFGNVQVFLGLIGFLLSEFGNFSIHVALRELRPEGTKKRKIPYASTNPFTLLFNFVSCPNYTYEIAAWLSFSIMIQSLPAFIFTITGFIQMSIWALNKHRVYLIEFPNYPRTRKAILPFIL